MLDSWVLIAYKTDPDDPQDSGVCAVFSSLEAARVGVARYVAIVWGEGMRIEPWLSASNDEWHIYVHGPPRRGSPWPAETPRTRALLLLERHTVDEYSETLPE